MRTWISLPLGLVLTAAMSAAGLSALLAETPEWAQAYYSESINRWSNAQVDPTHDLHAILIIDTWAVNAEQLGILQDGRKLLSLLETAKSLFVRDHAIHITILKDGDVSERKLLDSIRKATTGSKSTLLVYYSGHGGWSKQQRLAVRSNYKFDQDTGHFVAPHTGIVERFKIKREMEKKPAQLRILLTDSCGNFFDAAKALQAARGGGKGEVGHVPTEMRPEKIRFNKDAFESLFFRHVGWVSFNAASFGRLAPGLRTGGTFTSSIVTAIQTGKSELHPEHRDLTYQWLDMHPIPTRYQVLSEENNPIQQIITDDGALFSQGYHLDELKK